MHTCDRHVAPLRLQETEESMEVEEEPVTVESPPPAEKEPEAKEVEMVVEKTEEELAAVSKICVT